MIAFTTSTVLFALALAGAPASPAAKAERAPGASLAAAYKREVALLESERAALLAAKAKLVATHDTRATAEQRRLANAEAALVAARAKNEAFTGRLVELERAANIDEATFAPSLVALRAALGKEGVRSDGDLAATLDGAVSALEKASVVSRMDGGFFTVDGTFVTGAIVNVGGVASVAASATATSGAAGALVSAGDGVKQVVDGISAEAEAARAFVHASGPAPVLFAAPPARADTPGMIDRIADTGFAGWLALVAGALVVAGALARWLWLLRARRAAVAVIDRATALVQDGEVSAALGACRAAGGPAARLFVAVLDASTRVGDRSGGDTHEDAALEDGAADAYLEAAARVDRVERWLAATLAIAGVLALLVPLGATNAARDGFVLERVLLMAVPAIALFAAARGEAEALKRLMERGALRLVDAARRARGASA